MVKYHNGVASKMSSNAVIYYSLALNKMLKISTMYFAWLNEFFTNGLSILEKDEEYIPVAMFLQKMT